MNNNRIVTIYALIIMVLLALLLLVGCGSLVDTLSEVSRDVPGYIQESSGVNIAFGDILPDGSKDVSLIGLGYLICFLRKWYSNSMRKKNGGK